MNDEVPSSSNLLLVLLLYSFIKLVSLGSLLITLSNKSPIFTPLILVMFLLVEVTDINLLFSLSKTKLYSPDVKDIVFSSDVSVVNSL